ncbi:hypothetical protein BXZ70DRAFT_1049044 [Cristinia sonorae]|uniref:Uncharacterized protein n=1 Tax=Cristinia sonorae TaxID=1940300 RepID=A0A8K0UFS7_9AGAR|nr:hypothetical protein BXZ70DRAFT_1049044 [Cristinia sonorae]
MGQVAEEQCQDMRCRKQSLKGIYRGVSCQLQLANLPPMRPISSLKPDIPEVAAILTECGLQNKLMYKSCSLGFHKDTIKSLLRQIATTLLQNITGDTTAVMAYSRFNQDIRSRYLVVIHGWPADLPFVNPDRYRIDTACTILDGWRTGEIRFGKILRKDLAQLVDEEREYPEEAAAGRKRRSDAGRKRYLRAPLTRGKRRRLGSNISTPEFVDDSDEEPEESEDEIESFSS